MTALKAKGRGVKDIAAERLAQLNAGAEAATLTECLAVDFAVLMATILPDIGNDALAEIRNNASTGILRRMSLAASVITDRFGPAALEQIARHPSDTARGWACFMIGRDGAMDLSARLTAIRPYADDPHFGVREWSWMAVRPHLSAELEAAIDLLAAWTADPSERIRRFASEAIRPRGVWCAHIGVLKQQPDIALPVLEPLRADPSVYVQDSVANWLNDASKDRPAWVQSLCARWSAESATPETARICKRALRSIRPKP
ncbi:HEAT repeat domain-containing protein [Rhodopseudomonas pseudopalustris]|uniref:3-methyladenine DNA glycosylase AlkC n=1 Tax=Rhodopseudomonas pseudopalustris TaxID=1513892 RepID=A0A1H8T4N1_9BRAD|nr:HEAT repeat domain-containing protein [Rhodopseudomonas pseudopalustris]SEO85832.1 3-methyladenine DNA glycosylase AlkC [Rhodopseudomonas pseudopalustris]